MRSRRTGVACLAGLVAFLTACWGTPAPEESPAPAGEPAVVPPARPTLEGVEEIAVTPGAASARGPRMLAVVAHPDDEIAFGGVLYKTSTFLGGRCDVAVLTNGEAGYKYATLAEPIYGLELTREQVGRKRLPGIRRDELTRGCRLLGVHTIYWMGQKDHRYTQDVGEVLGTEARVWDLTFLRRSLRELQRRNRYDYFLVLSPTEDTHGHHKAASLLALEAALALRSGGKAPIVLCAGSDGEAPPASYPLEGFPATRTLDDELVFDRTQPFGYRNLLDYRIVINWAIAEHKSQGTMQLLMNRTDREVYRVFASQGQDALERARDLFTELSKPQFAGGPDGADNRSR